MTDLDITNLYQKWIELDRELKSLREEVASLKKDYSEIKWKQEYGNSGAVGYSDTEPTNCWVPQWEEDLK